MNNIGFKIVDKDEDIVFKILKEAGRENAPVELGLYCGSQRARDYCTKNNFPINIHFNHIVYSLGDLVDKNEELFFKEIEIAKYIGADYGVHHMAKYPMTGQKGYQDTLIKEVTRRMLHVEKLAQTEEFPVYIENTFESISFYRKIFLNLKKSQTKYLNFCFDIGHAKVWSGDNFREWITFLQELKEQEFKLHFHLHANRGLIDEHLSLIEAKEMNFDGNDGVFSVTTYEEMYKEIFKKFPKERKIFEVKPQIAVKNLEFM
jgi:sugar phosphate isomerase/epimerase